MIRILGSNTDNIPFLGQLHFQIMFSLSWKVDLSLAQQYFPTRYNSDHRLVWPSVKSPKGTHLISPTFCIAPLMHSDPWAKTILEMGLPFPKEGATDSVFPTYFPAYTLETLYPPKVFCLFVWVGPGWLSSGGKPLPVASAKFSFQSFHVLAPNTLSINSPLYQPFQKLVGCHDLPQCSSLNGFTSALPAALPLLL